jgi:hypothetical protein
LPCALGNEQQLGGVVESVTVGEAYLVDGMLDNCQLVTEGEARAARRTIEALDAGTVKES